MSSVKRLPVLAIAAGLAVLAGCGTTPAGGPAQPSAPASSATAPSSSAPAPSTSSTPAPSGSTPLPSSGAPSSSGACAAAGIYLTAVRTGQHPDVDRVVFEFSGSGIPAYSVSVVKAVYSDAKGDVVPLPGQQLLRVTFHGATAWCPASSSRTYTGPSVLTPYYPRLLAVAAAGDFEQVLSFGIGLAAQGNYQAYALTSPYRVVLDVRHVPLAAFPGIWNITSWPQYWAAQYSWSNGHQPWLSSPAMVVEAWARSRWHTAPVIRQTGAGTFQVTEPGGRVDTVYGTRPVTVPGPWVITKISYGQ